MTRFMTIDHAVPLSRGGKNSRENLRLACHHCNLDKGHLTEQEYIQRGGRGVGDIGW